MIKLKLPDGSIIEVEKNSTLEDVAKKLSNSLAKKVVAGKVNGKTVDVTYKLTEDSEITLITKDDIEALDILRHTTAHIMAQAVKRLFGDVKVAIGPAIETGFYYDFDTEHNFTEDDLQKIEAEMKKIVKENLPIIREEISVSDAKKLFANESYKLEILEELEDKTVSIYKQGEFVDLCRGPHLKSTGKAGNFKLLSLAGAYWRGDEKNKMLQRIYGTAFYKKEELSEYLKMLEEAKKRDHRKIGKEMDLFSVQPEYGPGLIFWHPKGAFIRRKIEDFMIDELIKHDYSIVTTPHIAKVDLWKTSGHWGFYRENMFSTIKVDEDEYMLKPMNCPFHILIYKNSKKSYRELPIRMAEFGTVYRYERSGVLHGMMRVRGFTQDDAHIFCMPEQLEDEIMKLIDFTKFVLNSFGFDKFDVYLSTRPEKYVGDLEHWDIATNALKSALEKSDMEYDIDPGEGVFYGPKIDIKIRDSLNRSWQCTTIQVDFNLPERFDMTYIGEDGKEHRPIMIHRALLGSFERFFGVLIENYAGYFPVWLVETQVMVLPISDKHLGYAKEIKDKLRARSIRAKVDVRNEKIGKKIRDAQVKEKIPYMLIVGDKEVEKGLVSVRNYRGAELGAISLEQFIEKIEDDIKNKR